MKMMVKSIRLVIIYFILSMLLSCEGNKAASETEVKINEGSIEGVVSIGDLKNISDTEVSIYTVENGGKGELIDSTKLDIGGRFESNVKTYDRLLIIEAQSLSYEEEASSIEVSLTNDAAMATIFRYKSGAVNKVNVTPLTSILPALYNYFAGKDGVENPFDRANQLIEEFFGVNVQETRPLLVSEMVGNHSLNDSVYYGMLIGGLSEWSKDINEESGVDGSSLWGTVDLISLINTDLLADGKLNGYSVDENGEKTKLVLGVQEFNSEVYRSVLPRKILEFVNLTKATTSIKPEILVDKVTDISNVENDLFDSQASGVVSSDAPVVDKITPLSNIVKGDNVTFSFNIFSDIGVKDVSVVLGDKMYTPEDLTSFSLNINSLDYPDGDYKLILVLHDSLGSEYAEEYDVIIVNEKPFVDISSPVLVNYSNYTLEGVYEINNANLSEITVNAESVIVDQSSKTWFMNVELTPGLNNFLIKIIDTAGNENVITKSIGFDNVNPVILPIMSEFALLSNLDGTFREGGLNEIDLSKIENQGNTMYLDSANLDSGGSVLLSAEQALIENQIPYLGLDVHDPEQSGVYSTIDDLKVNFTYEKNGVEVFTRSKDSLISASSSVSNMEYLIPFLVEVLGQEWIETTAQDQHQISVTVEDAAGNRSVFNFPFKMDVVVAINLISVEQTNKVNNSILGNTVFVDRQSLISADAEVSEYILKNTGDVNMYVKVSGVAGHRFVQTVQRAERVHRIQPTLYTKWRMAQYEDYGVLDTSDCPMPGGYNEISSIYNFNAGNWELKQPPQPIPGDIVSHNSDQLPPDNPLPGDVDNSWTPVPHFDNSYAAGSQVWPICGDCEDRINISYDYVNSPIMELQSPGYIDKWDAKDRTSDFLCATCTNRRTKTCLVMPNLLQRVQITKYESVEGPVNNYLSDEIVTVEIPITDEEYLYFDQEGQEIASSNGWVLVAAQSSIRVVRVITNPNDSLVNVNNEQSVEGLSFSSYGVKKYDRKFEWLISNGLNLQLKHGVSADLIPLMTQVSKVVDVEDFSYSIAR